MQLEDLMDSHIFIQHKQVPVMRFQSLSDESLQLFFEVIFRNIFGYKDIGVEIIASPIITKLLIWNRSEGYQHIEMHMRLFRHLFHESCHFKVDLFSLPFKGQ